MKQKILRSFQVILIALALMLMMVGQPAFAQTNPEVTYGEEYYIPNLWRGDGGYLDTRNRGCEDNVLCVSAASTPTRGAGTGSWTIVSATGKKADAPVLYNDKVYLQNGFDGSYLDTRNRGCEANDLCVSTASTPTRGAGTGTWTIVSATGKQPGTPVLSSDEIYLQNGFDGSYLDTKNYGCEDNFLCVSTSSTKERGPKTTHWSILYKNPPVAATPDNGDCEPLISTRTIGFETTPGGLAPVDNAALTSSYYDQGTVVTFGFDSNRDLKIDQKAVLESRKDGTASAVGYTSKGVADIDKTPTKEGGNWLLRAPSGFNVFNNIPNTKQADFLVVYSGTPVQSASGQLWDIDAGEQYKIEALDANGQVISTILTPGNIPAGEVAGTYDALPYNFSFPDKGQDISFIRISGVKRITGGGFAFDNFNATGSKPCETEPPAPDCPEENLIKNGGFELGQNLDSSFANLSTGSTGIADWSVSTGNVDYVGSLWQASQGSRSLDLSGLAAGGIQQTFKTVPGKTYKVTFDLAGNPGTSVAQTQRSLKLSAAGDSATFTFDTTGKSGSDMGWQNKTWTFTAKDSATTLTFVSQDDVPQGPALDNVSILSTKPCEPEPPIEACDPNKPIPGAFSTIRIGDFDGFGFREGNGLKSASGDPINVDGKGVLSVNDFLPDFNGDGKISNRDAGDPFDNRSEAEVAGTYLTGDGFEDMGSQGSDYTDLSLGKVFGYKTSPTYGNSFPDGDPKTLPNTPGFEFRFKVAKDKLPEGTPLFFNVVFGDYDVKPIAIIFKNSQGETVKQDLTASAQGKNDGMIASAFANLDFSQVFTDGDSSGEAGYWVGYLDVDFDAPEEPYLSFDFAEIGTKQIPLTPCPES